MLCIDKQCEIHNDGNSWNFIAMRGLQSFCVDYPYNWTDKYRDTCNQYRAFEWCSDGNINNANITTQQIIDHTDFRYNLNANEVCCECGGGAKLLEVNEIMITFQSSVNKRVLRNLKQVFSCESLNY